MMSTDGLLLLPALAGLSIVMGMDNILSVALISAQLDPPLRTRSRLFGLGLALVSRITVLLVLVWLMRGSQGGAGVAGNAGGLLAGQWSLRSLIKLAGGCFLVGKSLRQIIGRALVKDSEPYAGLVSLSMGQAVWQILFADQTQSLDSLVSLVGMAPNLTIMMAATVIELLTILLFSSQVARVIHRHPSIQTVAVCALLLVGSVLVSEGLGTPIPRAYVYCMTAFALFVELLNERMGRQPAQPDPVADRHRWVAETASGDGLECDSDSLSARGA